MFHYRPPADIDDLAGRPTRSAFLAAWHSAISENFKEEIRNLPVGNKLLFSEEQSAAPGADIPVTWNGFPLSLRRDFPSDPLQRWRAADELRAYNRTTVPGEIVRMPFRLQDEYCEWHAFRDSAGRLQRIVFTAEAPEYWIELARHDFDRVVEHYRQYVSPAVQPDDLKLKKDIQFSRDVVLKAGSYNPYNDWNTVKGCVHLTHPANTLGAEINLAARATIPRMDAAGQRISDVRRLACASDFGDPNRSSDPSIGYGVNLTVLPPAGGQAQSITLSNPVALYIDRLAAGVLTDVNDEPLPGWFKIVRGIGGRGLLAVLEAPAGAALGLDMVFVDGRQLRHGGQVAEHIQMVLYAKTADLGQPAPPMQPASGHCCMPATGQPPDKVNFTHEDAGVACSSPGYKEAYQGTISVAGGAVPQGAGMSQLPRGPSRMQGPSEPWNG